MKKKNSNDLNDKKGIKKVTTKNQRQGNGRKEKIKSVAEGNVDIEAGIEDDQSEYIPGLPKNFTKSPQDPEHADLHGITDLESFVRVYRPTSDDNGEVLGDKSLEAEAKSFTERNKNIKPSEVADQEAFLEHLRNLIERYNSQINLSEAIAIGINTKYKIRLGCLFNIEKKFIPTREREDYYNDHYDPQRMKTVQTFIQIANVPNSIRYAALGPARILEIVRAVKGYASDVEDPIGEFLKENLLSTDLENIESVKDLKVEIDAVLARKKIDHAAALNQVSLSINQKTLKKLLRTGKEVGPGLIRDLIMIKKANGDPDQLLKDLLQNDGPSIINFTSEKTVTGFSKLVSQVKSTVEHIHKKKDLIEQIRVEDIKAIEVQIAALKTLIPTS